MHWLEPVLELIDTGGVRCTLVGATQEEATKAAEKLEQMEKQRQQEAQKVQKVEWCPRRDFLERR